MHSLAICMKEAGNTVTGSDDRIYDPAHSRLEAHGLLPASMGWHPEKIHKDLDVIVLGMHAFEDNPELLEAKKLQIPVYSFPEFIFQQSKNKQRVVIAGSYGKTTVTSMVMHVLQEAGLKFDYLVGAQVPGFDNPVRITEDAPILIAEGDEYLASRIDKRPKFLLYEPHIILVNGISWDHINAFATELDYINAFENLIASMDKAGTIIYHKHHEIVASLVKAYHNESLYTVTFKTPIYKIKKGKFVIHERGERYPVSMIGSHNMDNIAAAYEVCKLLGIEHDDFFNAMGTFKGAQFRLEKIKQNDRVVVFKDFAHAPIKVRSTVEAVKELHKSDNLIACVELHTFSSLNKDFLPNYKDALKKADKKIVFVDKETIRKKKMEHITAIEIEEAFGEKITFIEDPEKLGNAIASGREHSSKHKDVILMMSSGNFGGMDLQGIN